MTNHRQRITLHRAFALSVLLRALFVSPQVAQAEENSWESRIAKFELSDETAPPPKNEIVFVGSSSIVFWKTDTAFEDLTIINRGFGGSMTSDTLYFLDRIVLNYEPRLVVLYAGDNDIARGKTPETVFQDTEAVWNALHQALPRTRLVYLSIKPSLLRWGLVGKMREANALIQELADRTPMMDYVDLDTPMLGPDGRPRAPLFIKDGLHLSKEGYGLWNATVRPYLGDGAEAGDLAD